MIGLPEFRYFLIGRAIAAHVLPPDARLFYVCMALDTPRYFTAAWQWIHHALRLHGTGYTTLYSEKAVMLLLSEKLLLLLVVEPHDVDATDIQHVAFNPHDEELGRSHPLRCAMRR